MLAAAALALPPDADQRHRIRSLGVSRLVEDGRLVVVWSLVSPKRGGALSVYAIRPTGSGLINFDPSGVDNLAVVLIR